VLFEFEFLMWLVRVVVVWVVRVVLFGSLLMV
jgi:hypothetical protein